MEVELNGYFPLKLAYLAVRRLSITSTYNILFTSIPVLKCLYTLFISSSSRTYEVIHESEEELEAFGVTRNVDTHCNMDHGF